MLFYLTLSVFVLLHSCSYELTDTGQGMHRVQPALRVERRMRHILAAVEKLKTDFRNSLTLSRAWLCLFVCCRTADSVCSSSLLFSPLFVKISHRCPVVKNIIENTTVCSTRDVCVRRRQVQQRCVNWVGSSVVHLGDRIRYPLNLTLDSVLLTLQFCNRSHPGDKFWRCAT